MRFAEGSTCEHCFVVEQGYETCVNCGTVRGGVQLGENTPPPFFYNNHHQLNQRKPINYYPIKSTYTRTNRFRKKILGAIQRRLNHDINVDVLRLLRK